MYLRISLAIPKFVSTLNHEDISYNDLLRVGREDCCPRNTGNSYKG